MTLLLCTLALTAHADTLADARAAERTGAWNDAAAAYGVLAAEGSGPARRRLDWLAVRQDPDGDWDGLEALDRSRRGGGAHAALAVRQDAEVAPLVRHEASLWLAGQALDAGTPADALGLTEDPWQARAGLPRPVLGQLVKLRAAALADLGRFDQAREVEALLAVQTTAVRPSATDRTQRAARHQAISVASGLVGGVLLLALLPAAIRGWSRAPRPRPWGLLPLLVLLGGTAALVEGRAPGAARWWLPLSVGAAVVHLVSAGAGRGRGRAGRLAVGLAAGTATLVVAWLSLWATDSLLHVGL